MRSAKLAYLISILVLVFGTGAGVGYTIYQLNQRSPDTNLSDTTIAGPPHTGGGSTASASSDKTTIRVTSPVSGQVVGNPLSVTGQATGSWYTGGSFRVELFAPNGNVLTSASADAQGDWRSSGFTPFVAALYFAPPASGTGTLVLTTYQTGNPQNVQSVRIPVQFGK